jgi:hypothetical protein
VLLFERTSHGQHRAPVHVATIDDPSLRELLGASAQVSRRSWMRCCAWRLHQGRARATLG